MRIRIFYVRENVREWEYSILEKTLEDRSHVVRISSLHRSALLRVHRREDKRKVWGSWGLHHFCSNSVSFARLLFLLVCESKILDEQ